MNKRTTNARAYAFALYLALTLLACAGVARTIQRGAPEPDRATRPGLRLHARGVLSLGGYALNLTFDSSGYPRCVELVNRES